MNSYSEKLRRERREELALRAASITEVEEVDAPDLYTYEIDVADTDFGFLPPFMKANMIKGLEKKLAAESDEAKKAEIQAKINKLKGNKKEELAAMVAYILDEEGEEFSALREVGPSSQGKGPASSDFNEKLHPRGKDGKFAKSEGSSTGAYVSKSGEIRDAEYDEKFKKEDYEEALRYRKEYLDRESKILNDQMYEISKKRVSLDPNDKKGLKKLDSQSKPLADKLKILGTERANLPSKDQYPLQTQKFYNPKTFKPSHNSSVKRSGNMI